MLLLHIFHIPSFSSLSFLFIVILFWLSHITLHVPLNSPCFPTATTIPKIIKNVAKISSLDLTLWMFSATIMLWNLLINKQSITSKNDCHWL
jgi:hypothetical protein